MRIFGDPKSLPESYGVIVLLLSLAGLFPFYFDEAQHQFRISRKYFTLTVLHIIMYTYVNVTSLKENWKDYAQPMIGHSSLTIFGNLILRLGSILITFVIFASLLLGSRHFVTALNIYVQIIKEFLRLGIDVKYIYRRVYILSIIASIIIAVILIFTAWHTIFFYKSITNRPPALKYYLMAFLANFYKILFLFYTNLQFLTVYLISRQLNNFLDTWLQTYREDYENQMIMKEVLRKNNKMAW